MPYYIDKQMNKCEHGDRISHFCLTDTCQSKEVGACQLCLKKYHSHLTHPVLLPEDDILGLLRKFTLDNAIKPKCRVLQEAVYNYFNEVKTELVGALETACKNIINHIGYPYLAATSHLTTYKRLKNKEYRKLQQKELKVFFEVASKLAEKELAKEQARIYHAEVKTVSEILALMETHLKGLEAAIRNYSGGFVHDGSLSLKITEVIRGIGPETPIRTKRGLDGSKDSKQMESKLGKQVESKINKETPKYSIINNPNGFLQVKTEYKNLQARATELKQRIEKVEADVQPLLHTHSVQLQNSNQPARDVSLDKKLVKELRSAQQGKQKQQSSESKLPNSKIQHLKMQLNNKEMQINEKKKLLIEILKPSERDRHVDRSEQQSEPPSPIKLKPVQMTHRRKQRSTDAKSVNETESSKSSQDLSALEEHIKHGETKNYAFTKLPIDEAPRRSEQKQERLLINKKLMIIPADFNLKEDTNTNNKINLLDSPLYKKRKVQNYFDKNKEENLQGRFQVGGKKTEQVKVKEVVEIKQNQQKSLALLLKSLSLGAEEAVTYLQSALKYAENNLSAAEYLTYLYLELNRPKDCLSLCNRILDKLQSASEVEALSINIINNKAAALNVLGRYSQAILILEQCIRHIQKDTSYKNLGDSYFSIGMIDKAIANYQKSLKINTHNDECYYNLAVCLYINQSYENARTAVKRALDIHPKNEGYLQLESHIAKGRTG